jgi:NAD(P)-dependent dehydrogenase (short-subunit alcohol dehydrogenase family)
MLKNQNIVVVGASGALGGHFLERAEALGANCASVSRKTPPGGRRIFHCDVTNFDELTGAVEDIAREFGAIDTVVNFVGTHHASMDFHKDDPKRLLEEFRRVIDVNLTASFAITMLFARKMIPRRHGHIIHLCSNASRLSLYGSYAYNASKHGLEGLIKTAAAQLAPFNIRVNGVAPGTVETPLNRALLKDPSGEGYSDRALAILAHTPTKIFATLDGVTETVVAMCLPQRHLTGNVVFCDDGYNVEGHSWPAGNRALYEGLESMEDLMADLDRGYPRK